MGRKLSPEEVAQLGLDGPTPQTTPPPAQDPNVLQQYVDAMGRGGSRRGGLIGGMVGGAATGGNPLGVGAGAFVGNLMGQGPDLSPEQQGLRPPGLAAMTTKGTMPSVPPIPEYTPDYGAAAADGATQAGLSGVLRYGAAPLAAKMGLPRVAGVLGARPPQAAVAATAPSEVANMSTEALKNLDTGAPLGSRAVQELAKAHRLLTPLNQAIASKGAAEQIPALSEEMASRVPGLADKTRGFTEALGQHVPPEKVDAAFRDALSVPEAASSPEVMAARSEMATAAVPQGISGDALSRAGGRVAGAKSLGVGPEDVAQLAADRAGYTKFAGPYVNRSGSPISQTVPQRISQAIAPEYLTGKRALQVLSSELGKRGVQSLYPAAPSASPLFTASPAAPSAVETLRQWLAARQ